MVATAGDAGAWAKLDPAKTVKAAIAPANAHA
jgi:hypothetical protein